MAKVPLGWKDMALMGYTTSLPCSVFLWHLNAYLRPCNAATQWSKRVCSLQ